MFDTHKEEMKQTIAVIIDDIFAVNDIKITLINNVIFEGDDIKIKVITNVTNAVIILTTGKLSVFIPSLS